MTAAEQSVKRTAGDIEEMLRVAYPPGSHVIVFDVRNAAGFSATRSCDALALGTWPSRGLRLSGFEIKVSRSDWLKEYREPQKADGFSRYCDEWWIVAGDSKIVQPNELPEQWGLIVANGKSLKCVKPAPKLEPVAPDRSFLAAFLKRAVDQGAGKRQLQQAAKDAGEQARREHKYRLEHTADELNSLREKIRTFEGASGVSIQDSWHSGVEIGKAVRLVLDGQGHGPATLAKRLLNQARHLVTTLEAMQAEER
jgi:hypothetical protein